MNDYKTAYFLLRSEAYINMAYSPFAKRLDHNSILHKLYEAYVNIYTCGYAFVYAPKMCKEIRRQRLLVSIVTYEEQEESKRYPSRPLSFK